MSDHEHGAVLSQLGETLLDERLVLRIGEGRCLVEHNDGRLLADSAGERDALLLAA